MKPEEIFRKLAETPERWITRNQTWVVEQLSNYMSLYSTDSKPLKMLRGFYLLYYPDSLTRARFRWTPALLQTFLLLLAEIAENEPEYFQTKTRNYL